MKKTKYHIYNKITMHISVNKNLYDREVLINIFKRFYG